MPKIDIIILTYNNLIATEQCIKNLCLYTQDFRLIIFDNGSTDNTSLFLKNLSKEKDNVDFYLSRENLGIICGRNSAYEFLKNNYPVSNYICFLDNDQLVLEGWQNSYFNFFEKGYDMVGTEAWSMRNDFYPYYRCKNKEDNFSYVGAGGIAIKKEVIDKIGLFNEGYHFCYFEDPDLIFRAYNNGFKIGWNYENKIFHDHKGPLLNAERKKYFMSNWKKFKENWKGYKLPVFNMRDI